MQRFIVGLFTRGVGLHQRWGFKEIHYGRRELDQIWRLFPDARVIVRVREPFDQVSSLIRAPWRPYLDPTKPKKRATLTDRLRRALDDWHTLHLDFRDTTLERGDDVMLLRYTDLTTATFPASDVFAHLGVDTTPLDLTEAFGQKLGSSNDGKWSDADRDAIGEILASLEQPEHLDELRAFFLAR